MPATRDTDAMQIMVVDTDDQPVGQATKQEVWDKGLFHRVVRLMIHNSKGQLLLQKRSPTKDIFPNCWDNSSAGHVDPGEAYEQAMRRELEEELGLTGVPFAEIGRYHCDETIDGRRFNRFNRVYKVSLDHTPQKLEAGKVTGVKWWDIAEAKKLVKEHPDQVTDGLRQVIERYY